VESRPRRAGIPISVKLILATSFVVAAAVGTAAWFSATAISDLTKSMIEDRTVSGQRAIGRESELVVKPVANAAAAPLSGSKVDEVEQILDRAIEDDIADLMRERGIRES
jgi:hypothetical protein